MIIRLLLLGALAGAAILLLRGRRTAFRLVVRRSSGIAVIVCGVVAVLWPGSTTAMAHLVGVGRGTDLVLYALCVVFLFVTITLYLRLREADDRFVRLARSVALLEAEVRRERATHAVERRHPDLAPTRSPTR